jgi:trigger factor
VNIQVNDLSVTRKSLVVTIDANEVENEHKAVVSQFLKLAQLPGFRPGKAPAAMVVKKFAADIDGEFKQKVMSAAYKAASEQKQVQIASITNIEDAGIEVGKPAVITVTVDVQPDFQLPEYVGLPTEVAAVEVTDAEVDALIENIRAERAQFKTAERVSQKGDYLKIAYEGTIDGKAIAELAPDRLVYAKVPQTWEEVEGTNEGLIPGLGQQISGLKAGDKKAVTIQFPAEFAAVPALAGKTAVYNVEVQEVRERVLPAIDEEFLKSNRAENLEGFKASIRDNLKVQKEMQNRSGQRRQVLDALVAKVDFALPESLVQQETQEVARQFITDSMRRGATQQQLEAEKDKIFETAKATAASRVKSQLILSKIAEKENIEVNDRDFDTYIYRETMRTGEKPEKIIKDLTKNRELLRSVQRGIIFDKTVEFLVTKATVTSAQTKA